MCVSCGRSWILGRPAGAGRRPDKVQAVLTVFRSVGPDAACVQHRAPQELPGQCPLPSMPLPSTGGQLSFICDQNIDFSHSHHSPQYMLSLVITHN